MSTVTIIEKLTERLGRDLREAVNTAVNTYCDNLRLVANPLFFVQIDPERMKPGAIWRGDPREWIDREWDGEEGCWRPAGRTITDLEREAVDRKKRFDDDCNERMKQAAAQPEPIQAWIACPMGKPPCVVIGTHADAEAKMLELTGDCSSALLGRIEGPFDFTIAVKP